MPLRRSPNLGLCGRSRPRPKSSQLANTHSITVRLAITGGTDWLAPCAGFRAGLCNLLRRRRGHDHRVSETFDSDLLEWVE